MDSYAKRWCSILPIILACVAVVALLCLAGCGSSGASSTASPSADASSSSASATQSVSSSSYSIPERLTDDQVRQNNEWANDALRSALHALAAEGVIAEPDDNAETLVQMFEFEKADDGYDIAFKDEAAGKKLSGNYSLPSGKVIICRFDRDWDYDVRFRARAEYADGDWENDEVGAYVPLFYPESLNGHFNEEQAKAILADVPASAFANSADECDFLVVYNSGASHIDEDYYMGGVDRQSTTTLVLVIDMHEGKIVHIENVGTDTPGKRVQMGQNRGAMLWDECAAYLNTLLVNRS